MADVAKRTLESPPLPEPDVPVQSVNALQTNPAEPRRSHAPTPSAGRPNPLPQDVLDLGPARTRVDDPRLAGDVPTPVLVGVSAWGTEEQAHAVAKRPDLPPEVSRALAGRGSWATLRGLAANPGSSLPGDVLDAMAAAAAHDTELARGLLSRKDIPPRLARQVSADLLADPQERKGETSGVDPSTLVGGKDSGDARTRSQVAAERVDVLAKLRPLRPADIALCMRLGRIDEAMAVVAGLAGVPTPTAVRAFQEGDVTFAMNQMRALGLDDATAGWLLRSVGRAVPGTASASDGVSAYAKVSLLSDPSDPADEPYEPMDIRV